MSWLPKSPKARRRLTLVAAIAPVLALAVGLTLWGLKDSISFFYTPSQADQAKPPPGRSIQLGGLVSPGSVVKHSDGRGRVRGRRQDRRRQGQFPGRPAGPVP